MYSLLEPCKEICSKEIVKFLNITKVFWLMDDGEQFKDYLSSLNTDEKQHINEFICFGDILSNILNYGKELLKVLYKDKDSKRKINSPELLSTNYTYKILLFYSRKEYEKLESK